MFALMSDGTKLKNVEFKLGLECLLQWWWCNNLYLYLLPKVDVLMNLENKLEMMEALTLEGQVRVLRHRRVELKPGL